MKRFFSVLGLFALILLPMLALAQASEIQAADFLAQVLEAVKGFGGLSWVAKVASIVMLLLASMKVSFLNKMLWSKLGKYQAAAAPLLGLAGGLLSAGMAGKLPSLAEAMAYLGAGAGAIILHEILDMVKVIPGIGAMWVSAINVIESVLGGPAAQK